MSERAELTAVLLCGGKGERLRPLTEQLPKPLVPLGGRPLLDHLLAYLRGSGIRRFVLCTGYKHELIAEFAAGHVARGWDIVCVDSGDVSMSDRLLDARRHVAGRTLICYGDTLANVDLGALETEHARSGASATVSVYPFPSPYGVVEFEQNGRVRSFREKPRLPYWINIGFLLAEPSALDQLVPGSDLPTFLSSLAERGELNSFRHLGQHLTVNTEKERSEAESQIEFFTLLGGYP